MPRWEGNARERFQKAALELFVERGYADTTVGDIAAHAGLTERTFFRYFKDKPEVLFFGGEIMQQRLEAGVALAPKAASPLDAVLFAFELVSEDVHRRRDTVKPRYHVIVAHPELLEREAQKTNTLVAAMAKSLRARKVSEPAATLAATTGMAVFHVAYEAWITDPKAKELVKHLRAAQAELVNVIKKSKA